MLLLSASVGACLHGLTHLSGFLLVTLLQVAHKDVTTDDLKNLLHNQAVLAADNLVSCSTPMEPRPAQPRRGFYRRQGRVWCSTKMGRRLHHPPMETILSTSALTASGKEPSEQAALGGELA